MSNAEALANEFETGEKDVGQGSTGKRPKAEQAEHKHAPQEGDTRRMVNNWQHGEEKRKEQQKGTGSK
ncbi:Nuclear phosphoprotein p8 [Aphelenchoides avenae]|nr:Nuclear phosphoprotein p8 [Aphelenchus avenae]